MPTEALLPPAISPERCPERPAPDSIGQTAQGDSLKPIYN